MPEPSRYLALCEQQNLTDSSNNCYICAQMRQRKPSLKQAGLSRICLLCNNPFCERHKGEEDGVCQLKHATYCSKQEHKDRHAPVEIFVSMEARRRALGEGGELGGTLEGGL